MYLQVQKHPWCSLKERASPPLQCPGHGEQSPCDDCQNHFTLFHPPWIQFLCLKGYDSSSSFQQYSGPSPAPQPNTARQAERRQSTLSHLGEGKTKRSTWKSPGTNPITPNPQFSSAEIAVNKSRISTAITPSHSIFYIFSSPFNELQDSQALTELL